MKKAIKHLFDLVDLLREIESEHTTSAYRIHCAA